MTRTIFKRLATTTLAAALALTTLAAAPARAGGDDLVKVLVGVTGIYIVSQALSGKHNDNRKTSRHDRPVHYSAPPHGRAYGYGHRQDSTHRRDAYGHNRANRAGDVRRDSHRFDRQPGRGDRQTTFKRPQTQDRGRSGTHRW